MARTSARKDEELKEEFNKKNSLKRLGVILKPYKKRCIKILHCHLVI